MTGRHGDRSRQKHPMAVLAGVPDPTVEVEIPLVPDEPDDANDKLLKRAKNSAYRYLTIRPRSRSEVAQKLRDREFPPDIISSVIDHLIKLGYLNDEQFARDWAGRSMGGAPRHAKKK